MLYFCLTIIHVCGAAILFGTGLGTAAYFYCAHCTKNPAIIAPVAQQVVRADWIFTGTSGIVQPLTGVCLVWLRGNSFDTFWIWGGILGYVIAAFCWFVVVYLQIQLARLAEGALTNGTPLTTEYYRYFRYWFILGWPAFIALLGVFYLMVTKPFA